MQSKLLQVLINVIKKMKACGLQLSFYALVQYCKCCMASPPIEWYSSCEFLACYQFTCKYHASLGQIETSKRAK